VKSEKLKVKSCGIACGGGNFKRFLPAVEMTVGVVAMTRDLVGITFF